MKFDTIIIGGGLSGLACGITLAKTGQRVAVVASGQSSLNFFSGSIELLGSDSTHDVSHPLEAIDTLPERHPYRKLGTARVAALAAEAKSLLADVGIHTTGDATRNHYRITPFGITKPAWLTLDQLATTDQPDRLPWRSVCLVNLDGFIDYPIDFTAHGLRQLGAQVEVKTIAIDEIRRARRSATQMRATSLARVFSNTQTVRKLAAAINATAADADAVLLPAVMGVENDDVCRLLKALVQCEMRFLATMPPAVTGVRIKAVLKHYFQMLGGRFMLGETVCRATLEGGVITGMGTNKSPLTLQADHYVLATGSFMSHGLESEFERIYEPLLGLDVNVPDQRDQWSRDALMGDQPFMGMGVLTDQQFHPLKDGRPLPNVYAIGQLLAGHNPVVMGDGTGVSLLSALAVAHEVMGTAVAAK